MSCLLRLVYASKAAFENHDDSDGIDLEVAQILVQSRRNNPKQQIQGVLYYGDGHFFQVLEGPREKVQQLYRRITEDPRHTSATILSSAEIDQPLFNSWSMKYIPADKTVRQFLQYNGHLRFDPFTFDLAMIDRLVHFLNVRPGSEQSSDTFPHQPAWKRLWNHLTTHSSQRKAAH
ncbi:BLUF domain-containing protein [Aestuariirhabdus sp. Z084]|uniref:BLUF domain-containing protein n=1 Tax=Aestuariirhabdus haliotis TaxID=2918751 RepID=UPI00201B440C|nr:BLUF domain-containing protein [Aestuariirhabdus haliotis]MCL6414090.1 BLUF domain-containing protein [Aestuariirhabdus haliotis]MCL6418022.1 BLUF domain-containing protein [Aestuariirhabdus haliotis]